MSTLACGTATQDEMADLPESSETHSSEFLLSSKLQKKLVAKARLPGRTIQFVEPEPGTILEFEKGNLEEVYADRVGSNKGRREPELSSVERYEALTGEPAPEALLQAQELVDEVVLRNAAGGGRETVIEPQPMPAVVKDNEQKSRSGPSSVSRFWFTENYCLPTDRNHLWTDVTTGWTEWRGEGVNYVKSGAFASEGSVWYFADYGTNGSKYESQSTNLNPGQYAAMRMSTIRNAGSHSRVTQADGDRYDHCINFHF